MCRRIINIDIKYKNIIFAALMAFSMSIFITFILVSINSGYDKTFLPTWFRTWTQAFICAFFGAYFFPRVIQKLIRKINFVEKPLEIKNECYVTEQKNQQ
jgi:cytochrome bd-type quinol oxidase subunit 2